ncbi:hypothetical protein A3D78_04485 [Candidatus Gottesmanbacteria bacterium RIFCSPHIGHO2_02_FULL_39_14]|uniref:indole-3-glycerol-phosphate synthase n=3 Tax=Candidatus Gottesmaniibacteriota TaxID=1752720 RepID=A0A1F6A3B6_9BACT|nr:MAG: hypothetical protein A2153_01415 [Candidatus Gottesmanbacteria bacterium RBG_16_38_7b]OGG19106.1 MAG: hypothetical protein A3D78_04485 [Candidatus Gottesmanbacteria bacterium RIFCSPHIGHO2_02_FULL_39_14]OGG30860.1 MAG: hypothetical protein A3I51_01520 [Candidatus Gottesmanbacteria bacterium RIFCSPLOWO2_02_FULL_38_8]
MINIFKKILEVRKFILMAEIKIKSPSEGALGGMEEMEEIAKEYTDGGADMISAVTEQTHFGGDLGMIDRIKRVSSLPILCKDFISDERELVDVKEHGADAVLLLVMYVSKEKLVVLFDSALKMGLVPIVEVDNEVDLNMAVREKFPVVAVNARNLRDLSVDRKKAISLIRKIPQKVIALAFSGVRDKEDVKNYLKAGAKGVLIGTVLMRAKDKVSMLKELRGV